MSESISVLYKKLYAITKELLDNYSDEYAIETINRRGELLKKISSVQADTKQIDPETGVVMAKIIDLDKVLAKKMSGRMSAIKSEISGLYSKSRAAVAYSANKK